MASVPSRQRLNSTVLVEYAPELRAIEANWAKIKIHALREHARRVFQKQLEG